jgi:hypothetical protein
MKTKQKNDSYARARRTLRGGPPLSDTEAAQRGIKVDRDGLMRCRMCSCTEREPCNPPCAWMDGDICDSCWFQAVALVDYFETAHRPNMRALLREVKRLRAEGGTYATRTA